MESLYEEATLKEAMEDDEAKALVAVDISAVEEKAEEVIVSMISIIYTKIVKQNQH